MQGKQAHSRDMLVIQKNDIMTETLVSYLCTKIEMSFKELLFTFILSVHTTVRTFLFLFIKEVESVPHLYLYFCLREECVHFFPPSLR